MSYSFLNEEERQSKLGIIVDNLKNLDLIISYFNKEVDILRSDNNYVKENVENLDSAMGPETSINISETLNGLYGDIESINSQIESLVAKVNIAKINYENKRKAYEGETLFFDEKEKSYKLSQDGHTVVSSNFGASLDVDGVTYNGYFHDKWIGQRISDDMRSGRSDLKIMIDKYYDAWNEVKIHSDISASLNDGISSRTSLISNLQSAEAELQQYLSDNGLPPLTTKN